MRARNEVTRKQARRLLAKETSHAEIQDAVCDVLKLYKIVHSVTDASRTFGPDGKPRKSKVEPGWPDITACIRAYGADPGRFVGLEVKTQSDRQSKKQRDCARSIYEAGGMYFIVRSTAICLLILEQWFKIGPGRKP